MTDIMSERRTFNLTAGDQRNGSLS